MNNKLPKSFRLSPDVADVVTKAAKVTGLSEGEVVEGCIINQAEGLVARRELLKTDRAVENVAAAGVKRTRDERSDKGTSRRPASAVLTKRQQS